MSTSDEGYASNYSEGSFWEKLRTFAKVAGERVLEPALKLYYVAEDSDTPIWAKGVIYSALGYFVMPIDAVPDMTPLVGYVDDAGALTVAVAAVAASIKEVHLARAKAKLETWFGSSST